MDRDDYADMFRYRMGQKVRWANRPKPCFTVGQRRWTQRPAVGPLVEYYLQLGVDHDPTPIAWVREEDLEAWPDQR